MMQERLPRILLRLQINGQMDVYLRLIEAVHTL
jgi:hypothetical protein